MSLTSPTGAAIWNMCTMQYGRALLPLNWAQIWTKIPFEVRCKLSRWINSIHFYLSITRAGNIYTAHGSRNTTYLAVGRPEGYVHSITRPYDGHIKHGWYIVLNAPNLPLVMLHCWKLRTRHLISGRDSSARYSGAVEVNSPTLMISVWCQRLTLQCEHWLYIL